MKFYIVENGSSIDGCYVKKQNAEKRQQELFKLTEQYLLKGTKGLDIEPFYVTKIETND